MDDIIDFFNNRELSIIIWVIFIIILFFISKEVRNSFKEVIRALCDEKIVDVSLLMIIYSGLMILFLTLFGFWERSLIKETVYWILFVGFPLLLDINKINSEKNYIKTILKDTFKGIIIIEFISNFYNFSLLVELVLIPIITFLELLRIISRDKPEYDNVYKLLNWIVFIFGIVVLIYTVKNILQTPEGFFNILTLKTFLISIVLTVLLIPFLYLVALWSLYESIVISVGLRLTEKNDQKYFSKRLFLKFGLNRKRLKRFQKEIPFGTIREKKDIEKTLKDFN
jgi:hypothetical protein